MKPLSRGHIGTHILAIDFETTGSTFGSYEETFKRFQGISFGAIIASSETFEPVETLYREIKFESSKFEWTDEAEAIHGITREHLEKTGVTQEEAATDLAGLIFKYFATGAVAFLGHNIEFDIEATKQLLQPFGVMPQVHHVKLETSGTSFITIGKYRSDDVFKFFGGADRAPLHNALDDAQMALNVAQATRAIFQMAFNENFQHEQL